MTQVYSDPTRESEPHALPDVEVFYHSYIECAKCGYIDFERGSDDPCPMCTSNLTSHCRLGVGFFWWPCFPGCLPDSDPVGPFETEAEAIADAQDI